MQSFNVIEFHVWCEGCSNQVRVQDLRGGGVVPGNCNAHTQRFPHIFKGPQNQVGGGEGG